MPDDVGADFSSETGVWVYFDASLSTDLDWVGQGTGIKNYEWRIVNDYPLKYSSFTIKVLIGLFKLNESACCSIEIASGSIK